VTLFMARVVIDTQMKLYQIDFYSDVSLHRQIQIALWIAQFL